MNYVSLSQTDAFARGGSTYWAGQGLYFEDNRSGVDQSQTYQIREWDTDSDSPGSLVTEFTTQNAAQVINTGAEYFETGTPYVITTETQDVLVLNNRLGFAEGIAASDTEAGNQAFEIQSQSFSAQFENSDVSNQAGQDTNTSISVSSNRGSYSVVLSANNLDSDELTNIFGDESTVNNGNIRVANVNEDADTITLSNVNDNTDILADFQGIESNDYNFDIEVADTSASSQANISVTEETGTLSLAQSTVSEQRGDVASFTVNTENTQDGYVNIGSDDVGYNVTLHVDDESGDDQVEVQMNTYEAGSNGTWAQSGSDGFQGLTIANESGVYDAANDDDTVEVVGVHSDALQNPLEAGTYDLAVSATSGTSDEGNTTVVNEDDLGTLELQQRGTDGLQIYTASGNADVDSQEELLQVVNQSQRIAGGADANVGDYAIVQLSASGIYGQLSEDDLSRLAANDGNGISLTIEEANPGANQEAQTLELSNVDQFYVDSDNNTAYLVANTKQSFFSSGESYTAQWKLTTDNPMIVDDEDVDNSEENEQTSTSFDVVEPQVSFDNLNDNDELEVGGSQNATVSGTTNIAAGSEVTLRLRSSQSGQAFLKTVETTVQQGGSFSTTVDMSNVEPGTEFTAELRRGGQPIDDSIDGVIVEQQQTETPSETTETGTPSETTSPSETTTSTGETTTATSTTTQSGGGNTTTETTQTNTPGFGVVVALVALVAAALLAVRREN